MLNIVIAAGYATRLYPLTEYYPKPLLAIGTDTIMSRLIDDIDVLPDIEGHIVVTNHRFAHHFEAWRDAKRYDKPVILVDDGTTSNETRLGAVRDLLLALERGQVDDDILVAAADNVLDFSLAGFVRAFRERGTSMLMCHNEPDVERLRRTGVVEVDDDWRIISMEEKPAQPRSHWAVPPFYIYRREDLPLVRDCLAHGCDADAPGNLARYLVSRTVMHAWPMPGNRFDIGSMDTYREAQERYARRGSSHSTPQKGDL